MRFISRSTEFCTRRVGSARTFTGGGAISVISRSQVLLRVYYCKRDEVYSTKLLWQNNWRQSGLISRMIVSELFKIVVKKVTFVGFRGPWAIAPMDPPLVPEARGPMQLHRLHWLKAGPAQILPEYISTRSHVVVERPRWANSVVDWCSARSSLSHWLKRPIQMVEIGAWRSWARSTRKSSCWQSKTWETDAMPSQTVIAMRCPSHISNESHKSLRSSWVGGGGAPKEVFEAYGRLLFKWMMWRSAFIFLSVSAPIATFKDEFIAAFKCVTEGFAVIASFKSL